MEYCGESIKIAREYGDKRLEALGLLNMGIAFRGLSQNQVAEHHLRQSLEIFKDLGEERAEATIYNHLGSLAQAWSDWEEARKHFELRLSINRQLEDYWGMAISLHNMAKLKFALGNYAQVWRVLAESLDNYQKAGVRHGLSDCFATLAQLAQREGIPKYAAWAWGVAERLEGEIRIVKSQESEREQFYKELQDVLGDKTFEVLKQSGYNERHMEALDKAKSKLSD